MSEYLPLKSKIAIFFAGPKCISREVVEGIIDRKKEIGKSFLGKQAVKEAETKAEWIKEKIRKDAFGNSKNGVTTQIIEAQNNETNMVVERESGDLADMIGNLARIAYRSSHK